MKWIKNAKIALRKGYPERERTHSGSKAGPGYHAIGEDRQVKRKQAKIMAAGLLKKTTAEEKVAQMVQVPYTMVGREEALR